MQRFIARHLVNYSTRFYTTTTVAAAVATTASINPLITKYKQQLSQKEPAVWETYESLKSPQQDLINELKREDFLKLRTNLWNLKENWGTEGRIVQVLEDMKTSGHAWTILEYNEYFIAKLFQAQHQDILTLYQRDFVDSPSPQLKLSVGSFNVILATYIQLGQVDQAIRFIKEANGTWDVIPDLRDFDRTMNRCMPKNSKVVNQARELIVEYGLDRTKVLNANLLHLFREKRFNDIKWIMESTKQKHKRHDITTYNILIKGYSDIRMTRDALQVYNEMTAFGIKPNNYICSTLLNIFGHNRDLESAENLVRETILNGFKPDESIYNQLIKVYFKCRKTYKAFQAFEEIQKDSTLKVNDVILNTMINGLVENKELKVAGLLYDRIIASEFKPDMITFNTMLKGYTKANEMESAVKIIKDMFKYNMEPDTVTYTTLIDSMFASRQPKTSMEIIDYIEKLNIQPNVYTYNAIINSWVKQGNLVEAESTFSTMKGQKNIKPTVHTYTNLIQGYIEKMDLNKAISIFQNLLRHDSAIKPDRATFNFMIVGFLNHNRLQDAYNCLEYMKQMKLSPTKDTWKILLDECVLKKNWVIGKKVVALLDASGFVISSDSLKKSYQLVKSHSM